MKKGKEMEKKVIEKSYRERGGNERKRGIIQIDIQAKGTCIVFIYLYIKEEQISNRDW